MSQTTFEGIILTAQERKDIADANSEEPRRTIGVLYTPYNNSLENYLNFANQFGEARLVMPNEVRTDIALLILPGGKDLSASHKTFLPNLNYLHGTTDPMVEFFRTHILDVYIESFIPIFGICLGYQMLGAYFGSKMYGHIVGHEDGFHSLKSDIFPIKVNTSHHQAISELGPQLEPCAYSLSKSGEVECVEAFMHKTLPISGVQWHPERMKNLLSSTTFKQTGCLSGDLLTHYLIQKLLKK